MIIIIAKSIFIATFLAVIINELANYLTYGGFIPKKVIEQFIRLDESKVKLNRFDYEIISTTPFIATHLSIFSKYYIDKIGQIPRWSKLHKKIKNMHKNLILKELQNNNLFD